MLYGLLALILLQDIPLIKIESAKNFNEAFSIAHKVTPSSSTDNAVLGRVSRAILFEEYLIVSCRSMKNPVKAFLIKDGSFVKNISRTGEGPGEYTQADDIITNNGMLIILDNHGGKLNYYNTELKFIRSDNIAAITNGLIRTCVRMTESLSGELVLVDISPQKDGKECVLLGQSGPVLFGKTSEIQKETTFAGGGAFVTHDKCYYLEMFSQNISCTPKNGEKTEYFPIAKPVWPVASLESLSQVYKKQSPQRDEHLMEYISMHRPAIGVFQINSKAIIDYGLFLTLFNPEDKSFYPVNADYYSGIIGNGSDYIIYYEESSTDTDQNPTFIICNLK